MRDFMHADLIVISNNTGAKCAILDIVGLVHLVSSNDQAFGLDSSPQSVAKVHRCTKTGIECYTRE